MIKYSDFYKRFGIRRKDQVTKPPLPTINRLRLPALSLVHYLPETALELGPNDQYVLFNQNSKPIRIEHILELNHLEGNPRLLPGDQSSKVRVWRRENPRFKPIIDLGVSKKDPGVIVVENYSVLQHLYKYNKSIGAPFYRTKNFTLTLLDNIGRLAGSGYNQFLQLKLPKHLPTVNELDNAQNSMNTKNMQRFTPFDMFFLLQIWIWLGPKRESGAASKTLSKVCDELNLVIFENGRWSLLNLGVLNKIRGATRLEISNWEEEEVREAGKDGPIMPKVPEPVRRGMLPTAVQKMFLRMLMGIADARRADVEERLGDDTLVIDDSGEYRGEEPYSEDSSDSPKFTEYTVDNTRYASDLVDENLLVEDSESGRAIELDLETLQEIQQGVETPGEGFDNESEEVTPSELSNAIAPSEADLSILETKAINKDAATGFTNPEDVVSNFQRLLAKAADSGSISVTDYRRLMERSTKVNSIEIGTEKLSEFVNIKPEALKITEAKSIPDRDTIVDKSMLKSTLLDFNSRYVKDVMHRDIASMVVNIQNAGYCIGDYQTTRVEDITGSRTEYAIPIEPIEGKSSTIRFMIPDVTEGGEFTISGTKYRTRMQRGD